MGHINPPIADGVDTLFEVSSTYLVELKKSKLNYSNERSTKIESGDELKNLELEN